MHVENFHAFLGKISSAYFETESPVEGIYGPPSFYYWVQIAQETLALEQYALLLESLPMQPRKRAFQCLNSDAQKAAFLFMQEESRRLLIKDLAPEEANTLLEAFDAQSLLELAEELPDRFIHEAYQRLDTTDRERFERGSKYTGEMAGHWVNFEFPTVYSSLKVGSIAQLLMRTNSQLIDCVYVHDKEGHLVGEVTLPVLMNADTTSKVHELMQAPGESILATMSIKEAADMVILSGRMALPVIEEDGKILGRLLLTAAFQHREVIAEHQISVAGGLTEDEDLFAPVWRSSKNRGIWLGINLLTAFLASWCIGLFEATLQQVVALAILMPVVASMGGISGSQTLTIIVRALALGKLTEANRKAVLHKELRVGAVNGVLWAIVIGISVHLWFEHPLLGLTIGVAILVNIVVAVLCGVMIPAALDKLKIDPALSGSVVLTTVTDVVGFVVFLGTGALILT